MLNSTSGNIMKELQEEDVHFLFIRIPSLYKSCENYQQERYKQMYVNCIDRHDMYNFQFLQFKMNQYAE